MISILNDGQLIRMFEDYYNNYGTYNVFAESYGLEEDTAKMIVMKGHKLWNERAARIKEVAMHGVD